MPIDYSLVSLREGIGPDGDDLLTVRETTTPGMLGRLLGRAPAARLARFIGGGTCWREYPSFRPCGSEMEEILATLGERARHRNRAEG